MKLLLVVRQAPAPLMDALCEHACELARELAHVDSARLLSRSVTREGLVICQQQWRVRASVPTLLQPHIEDGLLDWKLSFEREPGASDCRWRAESAAVQVPGSCHGTITMTPALGGRGTRIVLQGHFAATNPGLRTLVSALLERHWRSLTEAAVRRVAASAKAG